MIGQVQIVDHKYQGKQNEKQQKNGITKPAAIPHDTEHRQSSVQDHEKEQEQAQIIIYQRDHLRFRFRPIFLWGGGVWFGVGYASELIPWVPQWEPWHLQRQ